MVHKVPLTVSNSVDICPRQRNLTVQYTPSIGRTVGKAVRTPLGKRRET